MEDQIKNTGNQVPEDVIPEGSDDANETKKGWWTKLKDGAKNASRKAKEKIAHVDIYHVIGKGFVTGVLIGVSTIAGWKAHEKYISDGTEDDQALIEGEIIEETEEIEE